MSPIQLFVLNHESKSYNIDLHVEEMSILTFDYIQNTLSFIEKKYNFFQTSVFFGQNLIENKKGYYSKA